MQIIINQHSGYRFRINTKFQKGRYTYNTLQENNYKCCTSKELQHFFKTDSLTFWDHYKLRLCERNECEHLYLLWTYSGSNFTKE